MSGPLSLRLPDLCAKKKNRSAARPGENLVTNLKNAWIRYDCLHLDGVNQWFTQRDVFDTRVIEPVYVVPN